MYCDSLRQCHFAQNLYLETCSALNDMSKSVFHRLSTESVLKRKTCEQKKDKNIRVNIAVIIVLRSSGHCLYYIVCTRILFLLF